MTVRDFFSCIDTDSPRVIIYDCDKDVIYTKFSNNPIGELKYLDCKVDWIYKADCEEIALRIA